MTDQEFYKNLRALCGSLKQAQVDNLNPILASSFRQNLIAGLFGDQATMRLSEAGIKFIQTWEGLELKAYRDSKGLPTIGIGTTRYPDGTKVKMGDSCTEAQAYEWFRFDVARFEAFINRVIKIPLNQNQFDALISLVYNIGETNFTEGTVDDKLNANQIEAALQTWLKYVYSGGRKIDGLANRRIAEVKLFKS